METKTFTKKIICPICKKESTVSYPKKGSYRILNQDIDLNVNYEGLDPLFYSIFICTNCGYAARESKFEKIKKIDMLDIKNSVSVKWNNANMILPQEYDVLMAIKLHKLALLSQCSIQKPIQSELGILNLHLSWLYKDIDLQEQKRFRENALKCLESAFMTEELPLGGIFNKGQSCYIIAALNYLLGYKDTSLRWLQDCITSTDSGYKLKEKARDLKDLIKNKS